MTEPSTARGRVRAFFDKCSELETAYPSRFGEAFSVQAGYDDKLVILVWDADGTRDAGAIALKTEDVRAMAYDGPRDATPEPAGMPDEGAAAILIQFAKRAAANGVMAGGLMPRLMGNGTQERVFAAAMNRAVTGMSSFFGIPSWADMVSTAAVATCAADDNHLRERLVDLGALALAWIHVIDGPTGKAATHA